MVTLVSSMVPSGASVVLFLLLCFCFWGVTKEGEVSKTVGDRLGRRIHR